MSIPAAFLGVILIWSTTPLAIKWSGEGVGVLFGLSLRMAIGLVLALILMTLFKVRLPWHKQARHTYIAAASGLFGGLCLVYYGAQFIPSSSVALIFGLTPIFTGILAGIFLGEKAFSLNKIIGIIIGFSGLILALTGDEQWQPNITMGVLATLASVLLQSAASVWVKRIGAKQIPALAIVTGTLSLLVPMLLVLWFISGQSLPEQYPMQSLLSIGYLGAFGSLLGFSLYFYILKNMEASRVALITIITPILAMVLGSWLNSELLTAQVWYGAILTLLGLSFYQYGGKLYQHSKLHWHRVRE